MATRYVDSAAAGANNGTSWTDAYTSLGSAVSGASAGDLILVDDGHSETLSASATYTSAGTVAAPVKIVSVDKTTDPTNSYSAGATIQTNGTSLDVAFDGHFRIFGITFTVDRNFDVSGDEEYVYFEGCTIQGRSGTVGAVRIRIGTNNQLTRIEFVGCTVNFSNSVSAAAEIQLSRDITLVRFRDCTFTPHASQTHLVGFVTLTSGKLIIENSDLSGFPNNLSTWSTANGGLELIVRRCAVPSAWITSAPYTGTLGANGSIILESCASGTITVPPLWLSRRHDGWGAIASSLSRYRTGGADDGEQANAHSWEMVSNANALEVYNPLESPPMVVWVAGGASKTFTIYVASGATLNDDDFWIELSGPDDAASATGRGHRVTGRMAPQATPAALTTDGTSTWNGTGVGTKQKVSITYTPDIAGPVTIRCFLAKPSTTIYIDPSPEVT